MSGNLRQSDEMEGKGLFMSTLLFVMSLNVLLGHVIGYMYYGGSYTGLLYGLGLTGISWIVGALLAQYDFSDSLFSKRIYLLSGLCSVGCMIYLYAGLSYPVKLSEDIYLSNFELTEEFTTLYSLCIRNYLLWASLLSCLLMLGSICLMSESECYTCCDRDFENCNSTMSRVDCCDTSSFSNNKKSNVADNKSKKSKR